jgi:hypothetical protein
MPQKDIARGRKPAVPALSVGFLIYRFTLSIVHVVRRWFRVPSPQGDPETTKLENLCKVARNSRRPSTKTFTSSDLFRTPVNSDNDVVVGRRATRL